MMSDITIVTAFFDIGRENFKAIPRNNDKYFSQFRFWARIKNNLIVFTEAKFKDDIIGIRREFNLENRTTIVIIDDLFSIEPDIYKKMTKISQNQWFIDFRLLPNATSNIARYSYLMLMKSWFLKSAAEKYKTSDTIAWVDFGFNHGGDLYTTPEDFDFEWKYDFPDKICMYYYQELDKKPIFEVVRRLCDCFMGCLIVLPKDSCDIFWNMNRKSMEILNAVDLIDDDQLLLLMSYRSNPNLFYIEKSEWFLPLKEHGAPHLSIRDNTSHSKIGELRIRFNNYKKKRNLVRQYIKVTKHNLMGKH